MLARTLVFLLLGSATVALGAAPDAETIIRNSVQANQRDFEASPTFCHKERELTANGSKTYQVVMIDGSPYRRLIEVNGSPLSSTDAANEKAKEAQERRRRSAESASQRQARIAKFESNRARDHAMMSQLTKAFKFSLLGESKLNGFDVYTLKATPQPGYRPPNMQTQVLPGMEGELWIDTKTFQWVKVTAKVIHPVSIAGFLAQVEPGTQFELEKAPVSSEVWLASHFEMRANAKVLFMFNHNAHEEQTFWDYKPAN